MHYEESKDILHTLITKMLQEQKRCVPKEFDFHYLYSPDFDKFVIIEQNTGVLWDYYNGSIHYRYTDHQEGT